jgi:hypothetical protein
MGMGSWLLGISPPTDDASLRVFIDVLGRAGARLNRDVLIEPFCDGEWCLLVISKAQARDIGASCSWETLTGNCIVLATRRAVELLGLIHIQDSLTRSVGNAVDKVDVSAQGERLLRNALLSEVGFAQVSECTSRFGDLCTRRISAAIDAGENAVIVTNDIVTSNGVTSSVIAKLPRRMAVVRDPYLDEEFLVAWGEDGRVIAVNSRSDLEGFLRSIANRAGGRYWVRDWRNVMLITSGFRTVTKPISAGLTEDGLIDPYGVLDPVNHGVASLIEVHDWVKRYYGENWRYAWLNVIFTMAKLVTPIIRRVNRTYIDFIIWNKGSGFEGKSTLVNFILARELSVFDYDPYFTIITGPLTSIPQLRELISISRLPLILDEQLHGLENFAQILHASAIGMGVVGIHASRYGLGSPIPFRNLRGIIVFTNVTFGEYYNRVMVRVVGADRAVKRRFIDLVWARELFPEEAKEHLPDVKPVYGLVLDLVRKYPQILRTENLIETADRLLFALQAEYPVFTDIAEETHELLKGLLQEKIDEVKDSQPEDVVITKAAEYARRYFGTQLTNYKILRALLEHGPHDELLRFARPRSNAMVRGEVDEVLKALDGIAIRLFGVDANSLLQDGRVDPDLKEVFRIVMNHVTDGETRVHLRAKSEIVPFASGSLWGFKVGGYWPGKRPAYPIRVDVLLKAFLGV